MTTPITTPPITATRQFVLKGWHVLAMLVLFFGVDIAINTVFMVKAYGTFPGEISKTPYEDGLAYNAALAQKRAQASLGWRLSAGPEGPGRLRVDAADRTGAPVRGLKVSVHLERPATEYGQSDVALREAEPGVYRGETAMPRGAWDLTVTADDGRGHVAKADRRVLQP